MDTEGKSVKTVKALLSNGEIENALTALLDISEIRGKDWNDEIISLLARYRKLEEDYSIRHILSRENYELGYAQIINATNEIVKKIESGTGARTPAGKEKRVRAGVMLAAVLVVAAIAGVWMVARKSGKNPASAIENKDSRIDTPAIRIEKTPGTAGAEKNSVKNPAEDPPAKKNAVKPPSKPTAAPRNETFFNIRLLVSARSSDAEIFIDGAPAEILKRTPSVIEVRVREGKSARHVLELKKGTASCKKDPLYP